MTTKSFKSRLRLTNSRGFTIIELMVVTAVFGILTAIAVPQFTALQPKFRLNGAARQVFSELMSARMKAVNENTTYTVTFTNHTMQIAGSSSTQTVDIQTLYPGITFSPTPPTIQFSSRGTADVAPTITIHCGIAGDKFVSVRITGAVTIS